MPLDWITFYISRFKYAKSRSGSDVAASGTLLGRRAPSEYGAGRVENI
jgi:hypothetical protein